jgi:formylmethanofuran dehydrogenase subunit E
MSTSMKRAAPLFVMALLLIAPIGALDAGPLAIEDVSPEWYFPEWLGNSPHAPSFSVRDTTNKSGRYAKTTKIGTLKDPIKFHGHFCGGLVESAGALRVAFEWLFPDGVVDRTDLRIVSKDYQPATIVSDASPFRPCGDVRQFPPKRWPDAHRLPRGECCAGI